jgi:hypothetical protein
MIAAITEQSGSIDVFRRNIKKRGTKYRIDKYDNVEDI